MNNVLKRITLVTLLALVPPLCPAASATGGGRHGPGHRRACGVIGQSFEGALFRVDAASGNRTRVSDFGNPAQGPTGRGPLGLDLEAGGTVLVTAYRAGTDSKGALFRVDRLSGQRTLLSDFGDAGQGVLGEDPSGVAAGGNWATQIAAFAFHRASSPGPTSGSPKPTPRSGHGRSQPHLHRHGDQQRTRYGHRRRCHRHAPCRRHLRFGYA